MSEATDLVAEIAQISSLMPVVQRLLERVDLLAEKAERILGLRTELASSTALEPEPVPDRAGERWSNERLAVLREMWMTHTGGEIAARLNTLPGKPLTPKDVWNRAFHLGLKKRGGDFGFVPPAAPTAANPVPAAARAGTAATLPPLACLAEPLPPEPPRPAPAARPAPIRGMVAWSPARDALLLQLALRGPLCDALGPLNALPGTVLTQKAIEHRMDALGGLTQHRQTHGVAAKLPRAQLTGVPATLTTEPAPPPPAIVADIDQIRGFLQRKGVPIEATDVNAVNAYCLRIGAPRFILGERVTAARATAWARAAGMGEDAPLFAINMRRRELGMAVFMTPAVAQP
jgi:hypothetical protein